MRSHVSLECGQGYITVKGPDNLEILRGLMAEHEVEHECEDESHCLSFPPSIKQKEVRNFYRRIVDILLRAGFSVRKEATHTWDEYQAARVH